MAGIFPKEGLSSLEIHEPGAFGIAEGELFAYLFESLAQGSFVIIYAAVLAAEVALVGNENYTLKRFAAAEENCSEPPPSTVYELFYCHKTI